MLELRRNPIVGRWVVVNTEAPKHPKDYPVVPYKKRGGLCPFCPGNESMTPPEISAIRHNGTQKNTPGWVTRVVPNKFPALRIEGGLDSRGWGMFDVANGLGAHEIIIETPDHQKELPDCSPEEVRGVLRMYRNRSLDLRGDPRLQYVLIFKNYGRLAGASLEHAHSQLIALPIVPKRAREELLGARQFYELRGRSIFGDIMRQELSDGKRIVRDSEHMLAFVPYVSNFPFEIWVMPKTLRADFGQITDAELNDLADTLQDALGRLRTVLGDPPFNMIIHSAPIAKEDRPEYCWYVEITPKLMPLAGFEWGSGLFIVHTPPELAANYLRDAKIG